MTSLGAFPAGGGWNDFDPDDRERILPRLPAGVEGLELEGARWTRLPFYDDHLLIELTFATEVGVGLLYGLHTPEETRWLDGRSDPIHDANEAESLILHEATLLDYFRFFMYFVRGADGSFAPVESPNDIALGNSENKADREDLHARLTAARAVVAGIAPLAAQTTFVGSRWELHVAVAYDGVLFRATLSVQPGGLVEMTDDEPEVELDGLTFPEFATLELAQTQGNS